MRKKITKLFFIWDFDKEESGLMRWLQKVYL